MIEGWPRLSGQFPHCIAKLWTVFLNSRLLLLFQLFLILIFFKQQKTFDIEKCCENTKNLLQYNVVRWIIMLKLVEPECFHKEWRGQHGGHLKIYVSRLFLNKDFLMLQLIYTIFVKKSLITQWWFWSCYFMFNGLFPFK